MFGLGLACCEEKKDLVLGLEDWPGLGTENRSGLLFETKHGWLLMILGLGLGIWLRFISEVVLEVVNDVCCKDDINFL